MELRPPRIGLKLNDKSICLVVMLSFRFQSFGIGFCFLLFFLSIFSIATGFFLLLIIVFLFQKIELNATNGCAFAKLTQNGIKPSLMSSLIASSRAAPRNAKFSSDSINRIRTKPMQMHYIFVF